MTKFTCILLMHFSFILFDCKFSFCQTLSAFQAGKYISFNDSIFHNDRKVKIYLPNDYSLTNVPYPVFYVLDGDRTELEFLALSILNFDINAESVPKFILVIVPQVNRGYEFNPGISSRKDSEIGGAPKFLAYLQNLNTYLNSNYRTSKFNIVFGHSLGASFVTYAMLNDSNLFSAYILASPNYNFNEGFYLKEMDKMMAVNQSNLKNQFIYLTIGDLWETEKYFKNNSLRMDSIFRQMKSTKYFFKEQNTYGHNTTPTIALVDGLSEIFEPYWEYIPKLKKDIQTEDPAIIINNYYSDLSKYYNYEIIPTSGIFKYYLVEKYLEKRDTNNALKYCKIGLSYYPNDAELLESRGDILLKSEPYNAIQFYNRAINFQSDSSVILEIIQKINSLKKE